MSQRATSTVAQLSQGESELLEATSSEPIVAEKQSKDGDTATPPGNKNVEKTRKRPREW